MDPILACGEGTAPSRRDCASTECSVYRSRVALNRKMVPRIWDPKPYKP